MTGDPKAKLSGYFPEKAPPGVVSVYLFGSRADGPGHRESDVDVGVLLDRDRYPTRAERSRVRVDLASDLIHVLRPEPVDVVVLNDAPPELGRHIVVRGSQVFCRDAELDHAFVRDVQLRAADLAPFLRKMRRIKLESLGR